MVGGKGNVWLQERERRWMEECSEDENTKTNDPCFESGRSGKQHREKGEAETRLCEMDVHEK